MVPHSPDLTPMEAAAAATLWQAYVDVGSIHAAAELLGISDRTARTWWQRYGLPGPPRGRKPALQARLERPARRRAARQSPSLGQT